MSDKYRGKTQNEWIDAIILELSELKKQSKTKKHEDPSAERVSFSDKGYKSSNVRDAIKESRGIVLGKLNLIGQNYSEKLTIKQVIDNLIESDKFSFNEDILNLIDEDERPNKVNDKSMAIHELLKVISRMQNDIKLLKKQCKKLSSHPLNLDDDHG